MGVPWRIVGAVTVGSRRTVAVGSRRVGAVGLQSFGLPKAAERCTNGTARGECSERGRRCAAAEG